MRTTLTTLKMMHPAMPHPRIASVLRSFFSLILVGWLFLSSAGCVYRIPIQQGNLLDSKDIEQITPGMTPSQVRYLLGTPMIADPFTKDRWDYMYYLKTNTMTTPAQRHFVVYFDQGKVSRVEEVNLAK